MRSRLGSVAVLGVVGVLALAGCAGQNGKTAAAENKGGAINTMCPIGGHEVDTTVVREWKGQTIAFCCDHCTAKWDKMADADKDKVLTVAQGNTAK